jgi:hypothetical protein
MGRTFVKARNPYALAARQRRAGPHAGRREEEDDVDQYFSFPCTGCSYTLVLSSQEIEEGEDHSPCPKCGNPIAVEK